MKLAILVLGVSGMLVFGAFAAFRGGYLFGKPKLDSACSMNGMGNGDCRFTNTGPAAGSECGRITVHRRTSTNEEDRKPVHSDTFCSGEVARRSTVSVPFSVPGVNELCEPTRNERAAGESWNDVCSFDFDLEMLP